MRRIDEEWLSYDQEHGLFHEPAPKKHQRKIHVAIWPKRRKEQYLKQKDKTICAICSKPIPQYILDTLLLLR